MKIKYLGPRDQVIVAPYGQHWQGEIKDYPDKFGEELLASMKTNRFEEVKEAAVLEKPPAAGLEEKTVAELTAMLQEKGVEIPPKARKADLIRLLEEV